MPDAEDKALVLVEKHGGIATLTLNRPAVLNALNAALLQALGEALTDVKADAGIFGAIITGAGDRAFVAGADIAELSDASALDAAASSASGQALFDRIETLGKPVLAAVNGIALGGGCELAMACTFRLASETAVFGQPEVKLGLVPGYGGTQRLPRLVGLGAAMQMIVSGEPIDAAHALRIGLVNEVLPKDQLLSRTRMLLEQIGRNAPIAIRLAMRAIQASGTGSMATGLQLESASFGLCAGSDDKREGTTAFLEKRRATFAGR